jgi:hypothetical protein
LASAETNLGAADKNVCATVGWSIRRKLKMKMWKLMVAGCLAAVTMLAADATGKWTADMPGRDGNTMTVTMNLKADGGALTGTVSGRRGDSDISNGKVDGDTVTFDVVREYNGNKMTSHYAGKLDGDTIHFTIKMEGGMGGGQERKLEAHRSTT